MKKLVFLLSSLLFLAISTPIKAGNYSFTVSIVNYSMCDYTVCAYVSYTVACRSCTGIGQTTSPQCANIVVGGSNVFNITTPPGSVFQNVYFIVSGGSFYHIFGTQNEWVNENCNTLSNPFTEWTVLSPTSFTLESQNVLGGK